MKSALIRRVDRYVSREDSRGSFEGLINRGVWREFNLITSFAGVKRGGHYHKESDELFFIIEGEIVVHAQRVTVGKLAGPLEVFNFAQGDVFIIDKMVHHIFYIREPSRWINALSIVFDENHPDIFIPEEEPGR
jgi:dTDP-4-dehydrorhamnose 3,5-epimerase-like enzyme